MKIRSVIVFTFLIMLLTISVSGQNTQPGEKYCSSIVEDLQSCTKSKTLFVKYGEKVIINVTLKNLSQEEKCVKTASFWDNPKLNIFSTYEYKVIDKLSNPVPTIEEILTKKQQNGTITQEEADDLFWRCCINKGSRMGNCVPMEPSQERLVEINLSQIYHFDTRGTYLVDLHRLMAVKDGMSNVRISLTGIKVVIE